MSISRKVIQSSSLLIVVRLFQRLVGLISLVILARLLTPDDFAIVALSAMIIHFFDVLSNVGSEQYIIQKGHVSDQDLNTAWTIDILLKSGLWLLLLSLNTPIANFFQHPELQEALFVASFILIINACKNPGVSLFKRNLDYQQIFKLYVIQKLLSFIIVLIVAIETRSFWALIIGDIVASLTFTLGSYFIHNYRPKLSIAKIKAQWGFSRWLLFKGIIGYCRSQIDTFIVSKFFSSAQLGKYYLTRDIAMLPSQNILTPAIEPLLAAFKENRHEKSLLAQQVRFSLFVISLITIPVALFIWNFSQPIVDTLLGEQWTTTYNLLSAMALLFFYISYVQVLEQYLVALKNVKTLFYYDLISLIFITLMLISLVSSSLEAFAIIRGLLGIITLLGLALYINSTINLGLYNLLTLCLPILCAALIASLLTSSLSKAGDMFPVITLIKIGITYCFSFVIIYWLLILAFQKQRDEIKRLASIIQLGKKECYRLLIK